MIVAKYGWRGEIAPASILIDIIWYLQTHCVHLLQVSQDCTAATNHSVYPHEIDINIEQSNDKDIGIA